MHHRRTVVPRGLGLLAAFALVSGAWLASADAQPGQTPPDSPAGDPVSDAPSDPTPSNPTGPTPPSGDPQPQPPGSGGAPGVTPQQPPSGGDVPVNIRLRRLEQKVQALKERAWRAKARVGMLKEAVLGGGLGARAGILHLNKMGKSFRLVQLVYALDGTQIFARTDNDELWKEKSFEVLSGPISPGSHTISVLATYRGHGYGVFKYLQKYKFTVRSSHTFTAAEGKATSIKVVAFEKGGVTTPLEKRPAIDFKVATIQGGEKDK